MSKKYGIYTWRVEKLEAEKAKAELEGQVQEIELSNEVAEKQHDHILQDIEDEEKLRPITNTVNQSKKALEALKMLNKLKQQATELKELGIDVDGVLSQHQELIKACFA